MPFSTLLIGEPGSGKTVAACTAPGPVGVIDVDYKLHKMELIANKLRNPLNPKGKVIQIPIDFALNKGKLGASANIKHEQGGNFTQQIPQGYNKIAEIITEIEKTGGIWQGVKLGTLVIDSYTSTQEHLKRLLIAANGKATMTKPLYGVFLTNLEDLNNSLIRLPINVIIIAHQRVNKDEDTGRLSIEPMVEGQMASKLGKEFEEIYFMQKSISGIGNAAVAKYEMMTVGDSLRTTARTSRKLPALVEPDFCKIYNMKDIDLA